MKLPDLCVERVRACWANPIPPTWTVILALIAVQTGFGLYPVLVKKFNASSNPLIFSLYRDTLAVPVLLVCAIVAERQVKIPKLKELPVFVVLGIVGVFGSQLLYILAVYHVGPNISSVFQLFGGITLTQQLIPIWGTILAVLTCTEKIPPVNKLFTWCKLLGILAAAGGAAEMILTGGIVTKHGHSSWYTLTGYLFLFCNSFFTAVYVLVQKKFIFLKESPWARLPVSVTLWCYMFGSISMGLASIYYCTNTEVFALPIEAAHSLVYAVIISSALCYLLITWANQHLPATIVTAFWPCQVPVAVTSSFFLTGDELKSWQYIGAVMIIVGLCLVVWSNHQEEKFRRTIPLAIKGCLIGVDGLKDFSSNEHINEKSPLMSEQLSCHPESPTQQVIQWTYD